MKATQSRFNSCKQFPVYNRLVTLSAPLVTQCLCRVESSVTALFTARHIKQLIASMSLMYYAAKQLIYAFSLMYKPKQLMYTFSQML